MKFNGGDHLETRAILMNYETQETIQYFKKTEEMELMIFQVRAGLNDVNKIVLLEI